MPRPILPKVPKALLPTVPKGTRRSSSAPTPAELGLDTGGTTTTAGRQLARRFVEWGIAYAEATKDRLPYDETPQETTERGMRLALMWRKQGLTSAELSEMIQKGLPMAEGDPEATAEVLREASAGGTRANRSRNRNEQVDKDAVRFLYHA